MDQELRKHAMHTPKTDILKMGTKYLNFPITPKAKVAHLK